MKTVITAAVIAYLVLTFLVYKKTLKTEHPNGGATIAYKIQTFCTILVNPLITLYSKLKG